MLVTEDGLKRFILDSDLCFFLEIMARRFFFALIVLKIMLSYNFNNSGFYRIKKNRNI